METDEKSLSERQLSAKSPIDWVWRKAKVKDITLLLHANLIALYYPKYKRVMSILVAILVFFLVILCLSFFPCPIVSNYIYKYFHTYGMIRVSVVVFLGVLFVTFVIVAIKIIVDVKNGQYRIYCQESGQGDGQERPSSVFLSERVILKVRRYPNKAGKLKKKTEELKDNEKCQEAQEAKGLQTESDLIRDGIGHMWEVDGFCALQHGNGLGAKVLTQVICCDIEPESKCVVLFFHANLSAYKMYRNRLETIWKGLLDDEHSDQPNSQSYQITRLGWKYNPLCLYAVVFDRSPLKTEREELASRENNDIPFRLW